MIETTARATAAVVRDGRCPKAWNHRRSFGLLPGRQSSCVLVLVALLAAEAPAQATIAAPAEAEARQLLSDRITQESGGSLRLSGFRKTDGIRREIMGAPAYELEFEAQVLVLRDLKWRKKDALSPDLDGFKTVIPDAEAAKNGGYWAGWFNMTQNAGLPFRAQAQVRIAGVMYFERSERGWRSRGIAARPVDLSSVATQDEMSSSAPTRSPTTGTPSAPVGGGAFAPSLESVVPGGRVGEFTHGTPVAACYSGSSLVDIVVRGGRMSGACTRVSNLIHAGIDVVAAQGTEIRAIASGTVSDVIQSESDPSWRSLGYGVIVRHASATNGRPTWSLYLHMNGPPRVKVGDEVRAGESILGAVGSSGAAFGPHAHIEVRHFPSRLSARWGNIYGNEGVSGQGRTFDASSFSVEWSDPLALVGARGTVSTTPAAPSAEAAVNVAAAEGARLFSAGEFSQARSHLEVAAEAGNARAAGLLGYLYNSGNGVQQNTAKAMAYFKQSAEAGEPGSAYNLGDMYSSGGAVKRDRRLAEEWYARAFSGYLQAAIGGDVESMGMVGRMQLEGQGTTADHASAIRWLSRASDAGVVRATRILGEAHLSGRGLPRNRAEGIRLLRVAATKGDQVAKELLLSMKERW